MKTALVLSRLLSLWKFSLPLNRLFSTSPYPSWIFRIFRKRHLKVTGFNRLVTRIFLFVFERWLPPHSEVRGHGCPSGWPGKRPLINCLLPPSFLFIFCSKNTPSHTDKKSSNAAKTGIMRVAGMVLLRTIDCSAQLNLSSSSVRLYGG